MIRWRIIDKYPTRLDAEFVVSQFCRRKHCFLIYPYKEEDCVHLCGRTNLEYNQRITELQKMKVLCIDIPEFITKMMRRS